MKSTTPPKENVVFITGDDRDRLRERLAWWTSAFARKHGATEVERWHAGDILGDAAKTRDFCANLLTPSLFAERRMVILRGFPGDPESYKGSAEEKEARMAREEQLLTTLLHLPAEVVVVLTSLRPDRRRSLYKTMRAQLRVEEFMQKDVDIHAQVTMELAGMVAPNDVPYLVSVLTSRADTLAGDMRTLRLYGQDHPLTRDAIDALCPMQVEDDVFEILRQVMTGEKQRSLQRIERLLARGAEPLKVLGAFVWQMEQCILLRSVLDGEKKGESLDHLLEMTPFVRNKTAELIRGRTARDLGSMLSRLAEIDRKGKSGILQLTKGSNDVTEALVTWIIRVPGAASS